MSARTIYGLVLGLLLSCMGRCGHAATLVDDATLVGSASAPVIREFLITVAGSYELQVDDLALPAALTSLQSVITRGDERVATLQTADTLTFDATPGTYRLQIAGIPSVATGLGAVAARVVESGLGTVVLDYSDTIIGPQPPAPLGQTTLQTQVTISVAGNHRVSLSDLSLPESLSTADLLLTRAGVQYARLSIADPTADFVAPSGVYDVLIVAQAGAATSGGLLGIRIVNLDTTTVVYEASHPVGRLSAPDVVSLPATATYQLVVRDLGFPVPLASADAAIVRGTGVLATTTGGTGTISFDATPGDVQIYVMPLAATSSSVGAMATDLRAGATLVSSGIHLVTPPATSSEPSLYEITVELPAAGGYRATLTDFGFPAALTNLGLGVFQNGEELGRRNGAGTLEVTTAAGPVSVLVSATPGAAESGLYGVQIAAASGGVLYFETTQAAGAALQSRPIDFDTAASFDFAVNDLQFPVPLTELGTALTRGTERVGFVYGGGSFSFDATPGRYYLNVITRVNDASQFGLYGLQIASTPPAPTVTLTADPTAVNSGATTTLTWTSTDAASCVASGSWSGAKPTSGTQSTAPLTVASTFTLTCSGAGGSTSKSVTVDLRSSSDGGGGGSSGLATLLTLCGFAAARAGKPWRRTAARH